MAHQHLKSYAVLCGPLLSQAVLCSPLLCSSAVLCGIQSYHYLLGIHEQQWQMVTGQLADWTTRRCHRRLGDFACLVLFFWRHLRDRELSRRRLVQSASWQSHELEYPRLRVVQSSYLADGRITRSSYLPRRWLHGHSSVQNARA